MQNMKKRILSAVLSLSMIASMFAGMTPAVSVDAAEKLVNVAVN